MGSSPQVRGRRGGAAPSPLGRGLIPSGAGQTATNTRRTCRSWAHPRRCGADATVRQQEQARSGSSPQVRGRHLVVRLVELQSGLIPAGAGRRDDDVVLTEHGGLIPAGAGQTTSWSVIGSAIGAHSRRCGADAKLRAGAHQDMGSSPQVRGRLGEVVLEQASDRLIPAGAGKTDPRCCHSRGPWAHPRRCGADGTSSEPRSSSRGSSPQVRGRHPPRQGRQRPVRLIPAGAGQTGHGHQPARPSSAHPRRCGADLAAWMPSGAFAGSSPQVRGRLRPVARGRHDGGLIPAGAGQTDGEGRCDDRHGAHPRRCGADSSVMVLSCLLLGSSPQVRGRLPLHRICLARWWAHPRRCVADCATNHIGRRRHGSSPQVRGRLSQVPYQVLASRLIPAGAGQTPAPTSAATARWAHPRRCGADKVMSSAMRALVGSSPQVRGRPTLSWVMGASLGLIPAGAGQTQ